MGFVYSLALSKTALLICLLLLLFIPQSSKAEGVKNITMGIRIGKSIHLETNDFESFEIFSSYLLPWNLPSHFGWKTGFKSYLSLGVLKQDDETDLLTTISQNIVFTGIDERVSIDLGGGLVLLSDDKIGSHDFGELLQFNFNSGISYNRFFKNSIIGYRFFHISDAGIYNGRGLNRHMLEISYSF